MTQLELDKQLLRRVDDHGHGLTEWECDFMESVMRQVDAGREMTSKQRSIAERIDEDRVS